MKYEKIAETVPFIAHKEKLLLLHFLNGGTITRLSALVNFGIQNLTATVSRMIESGIPISKGLFKGELIECVTYRITEVDLMDMRCRGKIVYNMTLGLWLPAF